MRRSVSGWASSVHQAPCSKIQSLRGEVGLGVWCAFGRSPPPRTCLQGLIQGGGGGLLRPAGPGRAKRQGCGRLTPPRCLPMAFALPLGSPPLVQDSPGPVLGNEGPGTAPTLPASRSLLLLGSATQTRRQPRLAPGSALHL